MSAQQNNTRTAYFLDNHTYGYKFNPAFHSDRNFVSIPVLGNISLGGWIHVMEEYDMCPGGKKGLHATLHAGIEAEIPFYDRLSFGLLGTHRFNGAYSFTEGRLSALV